MQVADVAWRAPAPAPAAAAGDSALRGPCAAASRARSWSH